MGRETIISLIAFMDNVSCNISIHEFYEEYLKRGLSKLLPRHHKDLLISFKNFDARMTEEYYEKQIGSAKAIMVVFYISLRNKCLEYECSVTKKETYLALRERSWYDAPHMDDRDFTMTHEIDVK